MEKKRQRLLQLENLLLGAARDLRCRRSSPQAERCAGRTVVHIALLRRLQALLSVPLRLKMLLSELRRRLQPHVLQKFLVQNSDMFGSYCSPFFVTFNTSLPRLSAVAMCSQVVATTRFTLSGRLTVDVNAISSSRRLSSWWCSWSLLTSET